MSNEYRMNYLNPVEAKTLNTPEFYAALKNAITDPTISSCAYFGLGDFFVIDIMAKEQIGRAASLGLQVGESFPLSVHCDAFYDPAHWGADVTYYSEGLSKKADLLINDYPTTSVVESLTADRGRSTRLVLTSTTQYFDGTLKQEGPGFQIFEVSR